MTTIRRLTAVSTMLAVLAAITCSQVWGDPVRKPPSDPIASGSKTVPAGDRALNEDLASSKFSTQKVLTYRTKDDDFLAALQLQPKLDKPASLPVDYLILVDTSASQVGRPLANACVLTEELIKAAAPSDRISLWTVNFPAATRELTGGLLAANSEKVKEAFNSLKNQTPLGASDLPGAIEKAMRNFPIDAGRRRALVYLGDGMSILNPPSADARIALCRDLVKNEIAFFSVPIGPHLDPQILHGFATGTGGQVVRILPSHRPKDTLQQLLAAIAAPIFYPNSYQLTGADVIDAFPTRLPPLRADAPTLIVARLKSGKSLTCAVDGRISGRDAKVQIAEIIPDAELDNFFLVGMFEQWKNAKEQPAIMHSDRILAYAHDVNQFARAEYIAQAHEALTQNKLEAAARMFGQAKELDPNDIEADAGIKVVQKIREGKLTREQLREQFTQRDRTVVKFETRKSESGKNEVQIRKERIQLLAQDDKPKAEEKAPASGNTPDPAIDPKEILRRQKLAQSVEEQRVTQSVNDALNEARRILNSDPEGAKDMLKKILSNLRDDFGIGEDIRRALASRLESTLRYVETEGARVLRDQAERLQLQAQA